MYAASHPAIMHSSFEQHFSFSAMKMGIQHILFVWFAAGICARGSWSPVQKAAHVNTFTGPSDVHCEDPGVPLDSCVEYKFQKSKFEVNATWIFRCTWGFPRNGVRQITCQSNGEWSAPVPSCVRAGVQSEKYCKHPLGENENMYEVGWQWALEGKTITCMADGKWAGHVPNCRSDYFRLVTKSDDTSCPNIFGDGECSKSGETVSVGSCGDADSQFRCGKYGKWIGKIPTCEGEHFQWLKWQFPSGTNYFKRLDGSETRIAPAFPVSSPVGTFPWHAALATKVGDRRKGSYNGWFIYCSGALISEKWVLTAAHCLTQTSSRVLRRLADTIVFLGKHFRDNKMDDEHVKEIQPKSFIHYPSYDPASFNDDIGLLELELTVVFTQRIRPICLPQLGTSTPMTELQSERYAVVAGWGKNHLNEPNEDLGHVLVKYANMSECKPCGNTNQKAFFCGKPYNDNIGWACPGDSGGPLIFQEFYDGYYRYVLEGIVSWGESTCTTTMTSFIKVRPYLCWIKNIVRNGNVMGDSRNPKVQFTCIYQRYGPATQEDLNRIQ